MPVWLAIPLLLTANWITGALLLRQFPGFAPDRLARAFAALGLGIGLNGWLLVISAEAGVFSPVTILLIWGIPVLALAARLRLRPTAPVAPAPAPRWRRADILLLLWIPLAAWLFLRPHEYLIGGGDAGVYVNLAANIHHTGALLIRDTTLAQLDPALHDALLRVLPPQDFATHTYLAGFYATNPANGGITPQFYPLHPVWQAVAFAASGVDGALWMSGVWALLGGVALYLTARDQLGWQVALLALAGLSVNALQVWFARYPTTETLTQFLLWGGLWALGNWVCHFGRIQPATNRDARRVWALLAGTLLGQTLLARIDMIFILAVLLGVAAWLWLSRTRLRQVDFWWFGAPFLLFAAHGILHGALFSTPYFVNTYGYMLLVAAQLWWVLLLGALIAAVALFVTSRYHHRLPSPARARRPILAGIVVLLIGAAVYGWFIRPNLNVGTQAFNLDQENLIRLGWYLSPIGVALSVVGACRLVWTVNRRTVFTVGVGLFFSLLYLWSLRNNPHQIYAMRRHVPVLVPFAMLAAAAIPAWALTQRRRWQMALGALLAVIWLAGLAWSARGFISQRDYLGVGDQIAAVANQLEPNSVLLVGDERPVGYADFLGTPLRFLHGHDVYALRNPSTVNRDALADQVTAWRAANRAVYWLETADGGPWPALTDLPLSDPEPVRVSVSAMEIVFDSKPDMIEEIVWGATLWRIGR